MKVSLLSLSLTDFRAFATPFSAHLFYGRRTAIFILSVSGPACFKHCSHAAKSVFVTYMLLCFTAVTLVLSFVNKL